MLKLLLVANCLCLTVFSGLRVEELSAMRGVDCRKREARED